MSTSFHHPHRRGSACTVEVNMNNNNNINNIPTDSDDIDYTHRASSSASSSRRRKTFQPHANSNENIHIDGENGDNTNSNPIKIPASSSSFRIAPTSFSSSLSSSLKHSYIPSPSPSPSPTPPSASKSSKSSTVPRGQYDFVCSLLSEFHSSLRDSECNVRLAAQIGESLLNENITLKDNLRTLEEEKIRYNNYVQSYPTPSSSLGTLLSGSDHSTFTIDNHILSDLKIIFQDHLPSSHLHNDFVLDMITYSKVLSNERNQNKREMVRYKKEIEFLKGEMEILNEYKVKCDGLVEEKTELMTKLKFAMANSNIHSNGGSNTGNSTTNPNSNNNTKNNNRKSNNGFTSNRDSTGGYSRYSTSSSSSPPLSDHDIHTYESIIRRQRDNITSLQNDMNTYQYEILERDEAIKSMKYEMNLMREEGRMRKEERGGRGKGERLSLIYDEENTDSNENDKENDNGTENLKVVISPGTKRKNVIKSLATQSFHVEIVDNMGEIHNNNDNIQINIDEDNNENISNANTLLSPKLLSPPLSLPLSPRPPHSPTHYSTLKSDQTRTLLSSLITHSESNKIIAEGEMRKLRKSFHSLKDEVEEEVEELEEEEKKKEKEDEKKDVEVVADAEKEKPEEVIIKSNVPIVSSSPSPPSSSSLSFTLSWSVDDPLHLLSSFDEKKIMKIFNMLQYQFAIGIHTIQWKSQESKNNPNLNVNNNKISPSPPLPSSNPIHLYIPDSHYTSCMQCHSSFTFFSRRHHCTSCGALTCHQCAPKIKVGKGKGRVCMMCCHIVRMTGREGEGKEGEEPILHAKVGMGMLHQGEEKKNGNIH